jgi:pimeloyl-ACP methyl ester carboxylesterase
MSEGTNRSRKVLKRVILNLLLVAAGFTLVFSGFIFFYQDRMIYFPQPYEPYFLRSLGDSVVTLQFNTSAGEQASFYYPPRENPTEPPEHLWVLFHGNGSLALHWMDFVEAFPGKNCGFLMVDYPGYGLNGGKPNPARILENSEGALAALADHLGVEVSKLEEDISVLGFSLGAASGMQFAARHPVKRVVLLAPFTSTNDMAIRTVGRPLNLLLRHRFDNRARMAELRDREQPSQVHIFHGMADDVIPFAMSEALAQEFPELVILHPVPNADHNFLLDAADEDVVGVMIAPAGEP